MADAQDKDGWHFGGTVRALFRDAANVEIADCPVLPPGTVVRVAKADFAKQSLRTGVGPGDWVEGRVFRTDPGADQPYRLRHVTKII